MTQIQEESLFLRDNLMLRTYPIALKMLKKGEDFPTATTVPSIHWQHRLSTCQAFAYARRNGMQIGQHMEDMWCFEPVLGYGLAQAPEFFLQGGNRFPETASTKEAGKNWATKLPHFQVGEYSGIVVAPMEKATFDPDVIALYCSPAQLTHLMVAVNWIDGEDLYSRLSGHAACVYMMVLPIEHGTFQVSVPCMGDRKRAIAQDDEIIFSFPAEKMEDLVKALKALEKNEHTLPIQFTMKEEYPLEESYQKIARDIGLFE